MKRLVLCAILLALVALSPARAEGTIDDMRTVDEQLQFIDARATARGSALEFGGWDEDLIAPAAGDVSYLIPPDLESAVETDALPESMRGKKYVALFDDGTTLSLYGDVAARLPAQMRATRQIEADAVLYIRMHLEKSGKSYIPPATSYNRHYDVYAHDLVTGETYLVWSKINHAKSSGMISQLDGDRIYPEELWYSLRPVVLPRAVVEADGANYTFAVTGAMCCLVGVDGPEDLAALDIPSEAQGRPVAMIYDCGLARFLNLETVTVPDCVTILADYAFLDVTADTFTLPDGLREIGAFAFQNCDRLTALRLSEGLERVGEYAFADMDSLSEVVLPSTVSEIGDFLCNNDHQLARLVLGEGAQRVPYGIGNYCDNLRAIYIPASATEGLENARLPANVVVCAPSGSYALSWAEESGYPGVACADAGGMPEITYGAEGDFEYATYGGEAILVGYLGSGTRVELPGELGGCPLTAVGAYAFGRDSVVTEAVLPQSVGRIYANAFRTETKIDVYIPNLDAALLPDSFYCFADGDRQLTRIHAPAGGAVEQFVAENADGYSFVPTDEAASAKSADKLMRDVRTAAIRMGENAAAFWNKFDRDAYAWFARVPAYDMTAPEAVAVVRLTPGQYAPFAEAFAGANGFAKFVNTQYDADYAQASLMTNVAFTCDPAPDGMCAVVLLVYRADILFFAEDDAGNATAAMVVSDSEIADTFSAEYVAAYAAQLGLGEVSAEIYTGADAAHLFDEAGGATGVESTPPEGD